MTTTPTGPDAPRGSVGSAAPPTAADMPRLDVSGTPRVPFARLVRVEWRKMLDTRGGFWLLAITGILLAIAIGLTLLVVGLNEDVEPGANALSQILTIPLSLLLPVFAITIVTGEWSQRTSLVTFALEPDRRRVMLTKAVAVLLLALATLAAATALGAVTNVVAASLGGYDAVWDLTVRNLLLQVASQLAYFFMAFGLAMLILGTPAAIAVFYVVGLLLPVVVYGPLFGLFEWARDLIPWIDINFAFAPFFDPSVDAAGLDVARLAVAIALWVVAPLSLGLMRVLRTELK